MRGRGGIPRGAARTAEAGDDARRSTRLWPGLLTAGAVALLVASLAGGALADLIFGLAAAAFPVGLIALATRRRRLVVPLVALLALLVGSIATLWIVRGRLGELPWVAGLPLPLAVLFAGVWLLPLLLTGFAYAADFERAPPAGEASMLHGAASSAPASNAPGPPPGDSFETPSAAGGAPAGDDPTARA